MLSRSMNRVNDVPRYFMSPGTIAWRHYSLLIVRVGELKVDVEEYVTVDPRRCD